MANNAIVGKHDVEQSASDIMAYLASMRCADALKLQISGSGPETTTRILLKAIVEGGLGFKFLVENGISKEDRLLLLKLEYGDKEWHVVELLAMQNAACGKAIAVKFPNLLDEMPKLAMAITNGIINSLDAVAKELYDSRLCGADLLSAGVLVDLASAAASAQDALASEALIKPLKDVFHVK